MLKSMPKNELLAVIRSVHAGKRHVPPEVAIRLAEHMGEEDLTARELEVLRLIRDGYRNKQIADRLLPGRWEELRPPHDKELRATQVLALPLEECSVKVSAGPPEDPVEDLDWPAWAGVVPLHHTWGAPIPAPDLRGDPPPPAYIASWR